MPRVLPAAPEAQARRRWSPAHIGARVAQVEEMAHRARRLAAATRARADALAAALAGRVWLPPELAARLRGAHAHTLGVLDALLARLDAARAGSAALPVDAEAPDAAAPAPVA